MHDRKKMLDTEIFLERVAEMAKLGVKSIMYAGEGEPFVHRDMARIIRGTKERGIDVGITTNAVLLKPTIVEEILDSVEWIKVSFNAGTKETYAKVHRGRTQDYDIVLANMAHAVKVRQERGSKCTLGFQTVLLPENQDEVLGLAKLCREMGLDYLVVKPYSQHPQSHTRVYENISYRYHAQLAKDLQELNTDNFHIVFRSQTMQKWDSGQRGYDRCRALPFWSYIDALGNVWGCSVYLNDQRFDYGNIHTQSFADIWEGEKRQESLKFVAEKLDVSQCRLNCRMDKINSYLADLDRPVNHANFI
jgi:radical SAM protein with 4Fe4S-binding SPASM domain